MDKKVAIIISPNWHDYAKKYIDGFMNSLRHQNYVGEMKFYITDNETSEESFKFLQEKAPEVIIHRNKNNDGYAKGCNDSIKEALKWQPDYVIVFNIHTVLEPNCISEMIKVAESDKEIGAVQSLMMLDPEKNKISSLGNETHFLGFGYCRGYNEEVGAREFKIQDIFYPSGSSFLLRREVLDKIGLFDEEYWMYNEDQELGWRVWLAGWRCVLAPSAKLYNKYEFQRSITKYYWMDRNRIITILKCYKIGTLILILPAFIIMELGLILFSLKSGWFRDKIRMWKYFLSLKNWRYILKSRKFNQKIREVGDRKITKLISGKIWYQEVDDIKLRLINPIFNLYLKIARLIIFW